MPDRIRRLLARIGIHVATLHTAAWSEPLPGIRRLAATRRCGWRVTVGRYASEAWLAVEVRYRRQVAL